MNLLWYPIAAMGGVLVGTIAHEMTHALAAHALGELQGVGWQGGIAGGPYVDFRVESRWRSEVVRKSPLALGALLLALVVVTYEAPTIAWVFAATMALGMLAASPEDLFVDRAVESAN